MCTVFKFYFITELNYWLIVLKKYKDILCFKKCLRFSRRVAEDKDLYYLALTSYDSAFL